MKIVIVGHVDHGKSSLIGRLLFETESLPPEKMEEIKRISNELGKKMEFSFIIDNLKEERDKGITIDTAQTFFKSDKRNYVIIDAPGHKIFIKNMMTGASQADTSVLIIDAYEGLREQTKRHAFILSMMNLKRNIVVINKMDMVEYKEEVFNKIKSEINDFMDNVDIEPMFIIPISAREGDNISKLSSNMKWYNGYTFLEALDALPIEIGIEGKPLRFPVQDVYNINGKKIIVGRIESGSLKTNDKVIIMPDKKEMVIKSIEEFGKVKNNAIVGESIGITLDDDFSIKRGDIICTPDNISPYTTLIKCNIFWMSQIPFSIDDKLIFRCTTQSVPCKIKRIIERTNSSTLELIERNAKILNDTEVGKIELETETPVSVELFSDIPELGRFILEKENSDIVAGGIITSVVK